MKIYRVEAVISGTNDKPETRTERIIAGGWQEVHEIMARICRDTGCVIHEMRITETVVEPFDYTTVESS